MQKFFYIVLFSALMAGCNSNSATIAKESKTAGNVKPGEMYWDTTGDVNVDTIGLARNLAIRAARLEESNRVYNNSSSGGKEINVDTLGFAEFKRMRANSYRQPNVVSTSPQERTTQSSRRNRSQNSTISKKETGAERNSSEVENRSADDAVAAEPAAKQSKEKKDVSKKVSSKTKGAIIGAVSGAAAGAVINKRNRKAGGVVGAILGAAAGYGIGRHKDKKDTTARRENQTTDNRQQY